MIFGRVAIAPRDPIDHGYFPCLTSEGKFFYKAEDPPHHTVIVIGAGITGLVAAKTFLQCQPSLDLRILESGSSIGGVWKNESIYQGLRTNNQRDTFEFTDFPFPDDLGVKAGEHIPGPAVHEYLRRYAEKHDLFKRCSFNVRVTRVDDWQGGWKLECSEGLSHESRFRLTCEKLIVSTGLTSVPVPLKLKGSERFGPPVVNIAILSYFLPTLFDPSIKHVTVLGGEKTSFDAVYLLASHGKRVSWIMRASGHGPNWMVNPQTGVGPLKLWVERLVMTRIVSFLSPCLWGPADGFGVVRSFFHNTRIGRWISKTIYQKISNDTLAQTGLLNDEMLKPLIPNDSMSWYGAGVSILNYPTDIYNFVRSGQVDVLRKDIDALVDKNAIKFSDGTPSIRTDAIVRAMGWSFELPFDLKPHYLHTSLGIPSLAHNEAQSSAWSTYESAADREILSRFPSLSQAPNPVHTPLFWNQDIPPYPQQAEMKKLNRMTPWRLWRGLAPPGLAAAPTADRNIVFLGMLTLLQTLPRAEIQALWAWAWMNGEISPKHSFRLTTNVNNKPRRECVPLISRIAHPFSDTNKPSFSSDLKQEYNDVFYDTALFNRSNRWRTPYGYGYRYPDFMWDGLPYFDLLLRDLGVRSWRKGKSALGEMFSTGYSPRDYRAFVEEWQENRKRTVRDSLQEKKTE